MATVMYDRASCGDKDTLHDYRIFLNNGKDYLIVESIIFKMKDGTSSEFLVEDLSMDIKHRAGVF